VVVDRVGPPILGTPPQRGTFRLATAWPRV